MPRTLVTSALPYANGPLHLGHLAGAYLPADVYVRYMRSAGEDVVWVSGSDEHGAAISMRAKREGRSEQSIIDTYHELNRAAFARFGVSFDIYHRTSAALHHETSRELFAQLVRQGGQFEERTTEQYFDPEAEAFLADRFIRGTCPNCGSPEAFGDQCENCGKDLSPRELIDPHSTLSGAKPELRETKHWFFRLDEHEGWLREYIANGRLRVGDAPGSHHDPNAWRNHVNGQCLSWLDAGLQPRAFTRDLDWGIPVPPVEGHITAEEAAGKVLYVWFDAPIGYISATKQWAIDRGDPERWQAYWRGDDARLVHFIGKDNIVFHCLTFQATLKALGGFNVAENVPASQFLNFEGEKFSKSRGIGITMDEYLAEFAGFPNHVDAMRYALLRGAPENKDADFTWDDFVDYHDKELADKLGNFANRAVVLTHKYFAGAVPRTTPGERVELDGIQMRTHNAVLDEGDAPGAAYALGDYLRSRLMGVRYELDRFQFKAALNVALGTVDQANQELQYRAPWKLAKADPADPAIAEALFVAGQAAALVSVLFEPFLPDTAARLKRLFGVGELSFAEAERRLTAGEPLLAPGTPLGEPEILFAKIHDRKDDSRLRLVEAQKAKLAEALAAAATVEPLTPKPAPPAPTVKPEITYDDFAKLDVRTGTITSAAAVPKADKLLELEVDLGFERRTIVSGIAAHFDPGDLPGTSVLVLVNLAPRTLRGVVSEGMILLAEGDDGRLRFVAPDGELPAGSTVS